MAHTNSPLRYPGGKSCLIGIVSTLLRENRLDRYHYVEPYAGGCGLALALLYGDHVSDIHINDVDASINAFWYCALNHTEELASMIKRRKVSLKNWHKFRRIQLEEDSGDLLELAFATFFLNRPNRSGIIRGAGVIGGLDQTGNYKMDCRYNKDELVRRIRRVARYRSQIHLYKIDAEKFLSRSYGIPSEAFYCIDPPYFSKGATLYTSFYNPKDHKSVARAVKMLGSPWIVTYDNAAEIRKLYASHRKFTFDINYSAQDKRVGTELLIASKGLKISPDIAIRKVGVRGKLAA